MVRKIDSWEADDGSIHLTERDALIVSASNLLGMEPEAFDNLLSSKAWPKLLNLLMTLNSPRFAAPRPRPEAPGASLEIDTRTLSDVSDHLFVDDDIPQGCDCEAAMNGDNNHASTCPAFKGQSTVLQPVIAFDDLRLGQLVEFNWSPDDIEPEALTTGTILKLEEADASGISWAHIEHCYDGEDRVHIAMPCHISRVVAQPEQLLPLDEARAQLKALEDGEAPDMGTSEGRQSYARRVMLMARVAELEKEESHVTHEAD